MELDDLWRIDRVVVVAVVDSIRVVAVVVNLLVDGTSLNSILTCALVVVEKNGCFQARLTFSRINFVKLLSMLSPSGVRRSGRKSKVEGRK